MRILGLPSTLLGQAVAQVVYPTLAEYKDNPDSIRRFTMRVATILTVLGASIFTFIGLYGPELYDLIFGTQWAEAGIYARLLAPWFFIQFVSSPISTIVLIKERQRTVLLYGVILTVGRIASIWVGAQSTSSTAAVGLFAMTNAALNLAFLVWLFHLSGNRVRSSLAVLRGPLLMIASVSVGAALIRNGVPLVLQIGLVGGTLLLTATGFALQTTRQSQ